jgi:signal transduction histidine kinase
MGPACGPDTLLLGRNLQDFWSQSGRRNPQYRNTYATRTPRRSHADKSADRRERQAAILKERARLARDVHDTLAQGFTGVILQMEAAEEALFDENPDAAVQHVRRAREIARESLGEARRSVHALRPQALDKSGFAEALQSMLKNTTAGTSLRTSFCWEGEPMVLPANVEEALLRIGQEALSNALKHAHPTEFHIRLCLKSDAVRLEFFDNGKGFVVGQTNVGIGLCQPCNPG